MRFQRGIAASPLASDQWIVGKDSLEDILSNRSRGVLPRKFNALWPNPELKRRRTEFFGSARTPVLALRSALGSHFCVALSSV